MEKAECCIQHAHEVSRIDMLESNTKEMKGSLGEIAKYIPRIEIMLNQLTTLVQENKEIGVEIRNTQKELFELKLKLSEHDNYIKSAKERGSEVRKAVYAIIGTGVLQLAGFLFLLYKGH